MATNQTKIEQLKTQGSSALSSGKFKEAIKNFSDCIELDPNQPDIHVCFENRSAAYFSSGQHPQAFEDAVKAIQMCPSYTKSYIRAAVVLEQYNQTKEAKEFYARGLQYEPNNKELQKGYLACKTKEEQLALEKKSKRGGHSHSHGHGGGHSHGHSHGHDDNCNHEDEDDHHDEDDHCGHDHAGGHSHSHAHGGGHSHSHGHSHQPPPPPKYIPGSIDDKDDDTQAEAAAASQMIIPNPTVPLQCEQLDASNTGNDEAFNEELALHKMLEKQHYSSLDIGALEAYTAQQISAEFRDTNAYNALKLALQAHNLPTREERVTGAQKALELCSASAEAYNVLAVNSNTLTEALEYYRKGAEVAPAMVPEGKFEEWISDKDIWAHLSMRSFHRCKQGIANSLRKLGKYDEALKEYLQLTAMDTVHAEMTSYVNFRYNIPDVYLSLKKYKDLRKFLKENEKVLKVPSASLVWIYSTCLLDFIEAGDSADLPVAQMIGANHKAVEYMLGTKPLPNTPNCSIVGGQFSVSNAVNFVRTYRKHWLATEGALQWLAAKWQQIAFSEAAKALSMNNIKKFFQFVRKQPTIITINVSGKSLVHDASFQGHLDVVKYILDNGGQVNINKRTPKDQGALTPLHMASYNGHVDVVNLLLSKGADVSIADASGACPIHLAANQGYWKVIDVLLAANTKLLEAESKMGTPLACCFGSVEMCLKGIEKCQRCQNSQIPHGPECSPVKSVQLLLERGSNPNIIHNKQSLLHLGVECEMESSLELVLQKCDKALLTHKDNRNRTPMQAATIKGNLKAITILQKYSSPPKPSCQNCGQPESDSQKLMVCSVCKEAKYCSRECQKVSVITTISADIQSNIGNNTKPSARNNNHKDIRAISP